MIFPLAFILSVNGGEHHKLRLQQTRAELARAWPQQPFNQLPAVDAARVKLTPTETLSKEGYACNQSHLNALTVAINAGLEELVIVEDDIICHSDFNRELEQFLTRVPADWQMLMLGGEHRMAPVAVCPGVVRCTSTLRTHAYVIRGKMLRWAASELKDSKDWFDILLSRRLQGRFPVYAPAPFWLCGQRAGVSTITGQPVPELWFNPSDRLPNP